MIRLMIVDDEKDSLLLYKLMFRNEIQKGLVELFCYDSSEKALQAYKNEFSEPIDLILSDINMPNMDGFEFLKEIKKINNQQFIYMVSAYGDEMHINEAKSLGASDYISKPVNFPHLKELIFQSIAA